MPKLFIVNEVPQVPVAATFLISFDENGVRQGRPLTCGVKCLSAVCADRGKDNRWSFPFGNGDKPVLTAGTERSITVSELVSDVETRVNDLVFFITE